MCRPDFIVFNKKRLLADPEQLPVGARTRTNTTYYLDEECLSWAQLEATAEYLSAGDSRTDGLAKAISYTIYHLLSRPDRVVVPGFFFSPAGVTLIFTGASGTCHTELEWTNDDHLQLLSDFVERVFKPSPDMIDPFIVRNANDTFNITLNGVLYDKCRISSLGRGFGRRTTIFNTNNLAVPVIKEQYLISRSPEADILGRVRGVPGVVQLHDHQEYRNGEHIVGCTIGERPRYKVRLALKDIGTPLQDSQTLEDFLIRLYDLLEISQCLYDKQVLHRDFSLNNLLFRNATFVEGSEDSIFCSARHLLDPTQDRLKTESLLIDFEHGTDCKTQRPLDSAGTPLYQARATLNLSPLKPDIAFITSMPGLIPDAQQRYQETHPERLSRFPPDGKKYPFEATQLDTKREWFHELRHDVESAFWMLLHWVILLRPNNSKEVTYIPDTFWGLFVKSRERKVLVPKISSVEDDAEWLDPAYLPVHPLLQNMASHLKTDLHWVSEEQGFPSQMTDPSYLREVFQREILNFLFKNKGQPFMIQIRHKENRQVGKPVCKIASLSTPQIESRQSSRSSGFKRAYEQVEGDGGGDGKGDGKDQKSTRKKSRTNSDASSGPDYKPGQ